MVSCPGPATQQREGQPWGPPRSVPAVRHRHGQRGQLRTSEYRWEACFPPALGEQRVGFKFPRRTPWWVRDLSKCSTRGPSHGAPSQSPHTLPGPRPRCLGHLGAPQLCTWHPHPGPWVDPGTGGDGNMRCSHSVLRIRDDGGVQIRSASAHSGWSTLVPRLGAIPGPLAVLVHVTARLRKPAEAVASLSGSRGHARG